MTEPTPTPPIPPTPPTPEAAPRKASRVRTILMLTIGGFALAVGGGALVLGNLNMNGDSPIANIGAVIFVGGMLLLIVGVLWAFVRFIDRRFARSQAK